jgi:peptidoglycan L-alanyl-D-glutamate endopeptidase CwlK
MPVLGTKSKERLATCHPLLQRVLKSAILDFDFSVICGVRTAEEQNRAYDIGASRLRYPQSKHNSTPSMAVDITPFPLDWNDTLAFRALAVVVKRHWDAIPLAEREGFRLVWGGDWARFVDMPHWELSKA